MAEPLYSPVGGYGTQVDGWNFVQTPSGGQWSTTPASNVVTQPDVLGATAPPAPTGGGDLRQQMESGAIPWDDNLLNTSTGDEQAEADRLAAEQRAAIESGYGGYEAELDAMLNEGLPGQQAGLEAQASASLEGGLADLLGQKTEGEIDLEKTRRTTKETQARNLKDLSANLRNSMMAGNVFLGARGAGDSSAADMYSYALTKLGSKQRGDLMGQSATIMDNINDRASKLVNIYNTEKTKLQSSYSERIGQIQQWFAEQQNALRGTKGELAVRKGQDLASLSQNLLNQALSELNFIKQEASNRQSMLDAWAMNNATNIQQLQSNMAAVSGYSPTQPKSQPIVGQPQMSGTGLNVRSSYAPGGSTSEEDRLFGG